MLKLKIHNFQKNKKIKQKYICPKQGGNNNSPKISWSSIPNAKSYALILEDPDAVIGNFVHWYLPFISSELSQINSLDYNLQRENIRRNSSFPKNLENNLQIIHGKNTLNKIGYHGPCAPERSGTHRYIFTLYALNGKLNNLDSLQISGTSEFETILQKNNIQIINSEKKEFLYSFKDYIDN